MLGGVKIADTYGVPNQFLANNGKVFTGTFEPGTGEVLFDLMVFPNGKVRRPALAGRLEQKP
jgi:hypothetical protein